MPNLAHKTLNTPHHAHSKTLKPPAFAAESIPQHSLSHIQRSTSLNQTIPSQNKIQPKLKLGTPGDQYEQEADARAEQVMRMPEPRVQRTCACGGHCPECQSRHPIQRIKNSATDSEPQPYASAIVDNALRAPGQPLSSATRAYFEPRFGHDFSAVRVHTGELANASAHSINALAYTANNRIVFADNMYQPETHNGHRLLAHELTHVIQQERTARTVQRTVAPSSTCAPNVHNAPANPLDQLRQVDALAQNMALGASGVLFLESATFNDPRFGGRSEIYTAYQNWFGTPTQTASGAWRSRFRTATFATEDEATRHEMQTLSDRFARIARWLSQNIHYRCPGTASYTIPGCSPGPCGTRAAQTCRLGSRTIGICPRFWLEPAPQDRAQAALLIHEAMHPLFHVHAHSTASLPGRGRNPGCYQGFVLDIYNTGLIPGDCTII